MARIKIREDPNWPPDPEGTNPNLPASSQQAKLKMVSPKQVDCLVTFVGEFEGEHTYDYRASSEELAEAIRQTLESNLGTSIFGLGDLELEAGEKSAA